MTSFPRAHAAVARRLRGARGSARVWTLNGILALAALMVLVAAVAPIRPVAVATPLPWYLLAIGFYAAEVRVVHFQFRREVHTFSLSEIPFVLGLFLATPIDLVLAYVVGTAVALTVHRRQPPVKLAFNLSQFALGAVLGVTAFHLLRGPGPAIVAADWVAALVATLVTNIVGISAITLAIALSDRRLELAKLSDVFRFGLAVGTTNTLVVLAGITFASGDPGALWLLALPAAILYLAYRAYVSEREKHESLEFLYESTTILQRTPELDRAIVEVLAHARRMFKADVAELTLVPSGDARNALRTALGPHDEPEVMVPVAAADLAAMWKGMGTDSEARLIPRSASGGRTAGISPRYHLRDALVAPLRGDRGVVGMLVVGDRWSDVSTFDAEDLRLLETLARHVGIALENGRLGESLTQLTELKEQLRHQAFHDSLTGLGNRALFLERVAAALSRVDQPARPVVLFVDLDDFKTVNDSLGHAAGDSLLVAVATRLRSCLRPSDLPARLGGDEFAVLLEASELEQALNVAERIIAALHQPFMVGDNEVVVRASVGIAPSTSPTDTPEELLRDADVAMYTAKAHGKGRVAVFEPEMHAAVVARHAMTGRLQHAVSREQFTLLYQPIVDLATGAIVGTEALVRWKQPNGDLMGPTAFIPLAEETGLILPLGRWVLETACREAARRQSALPGRPFHMGVNLSPRQVQQPGFVDELAEVLSVTGIEPGSLILEITENVMMQDTQVTITKLDALKALGVQLAIDDFGTGYSSLSYLRRFPVDVLKMAKPFVETARPGREDSAFARAIIALGHSLGLRIIAEGIERPDQLELLRDLGCDLGQGFYFSEPVDATRLTGLLGRSDRPVAVVPVRADPGQPHVVGYTQRSVDRTGFPSPSILRPTPIH